MLEIPFISELIAVAEVKETRYVCVTLIMSLSAFKNYCAQHNLMPMQEEMQNAYDNMEALLEEIDPELQREQSKEQEEAEAAWKETFYSVYCEKFNKMKNSTLIGKDKYDRIVKVILEYQRLRRRGPSKAPAPKDAIKFSKIYDLKSNIGGRCLYRNNKLVTTYEDVFDVMKQAHVSLSHPRDIKKNKCKLDEVYYSIPESCIKEFLRLCPYCVPSRTKKEQHKAPLKMILTPRIGHRAQIDLIDMGALAIEGVRYVLRYVDHLSGFSYVDTLKTKSAEEVGVKLLKILSTAVIPELLQSDNGNEFLGKCIEIIKTFYKNIHIVKGRPYHPQSQGKVERGHAPFKEAIQKWMAQHGPNWMIGVYIVNHEINQRAQWNRDNLTPYNMMYGKKGTQRNTVVFGEAAVSHAKTEYGILCAKYFCIQAKKWSPARLVREEELQYVMAKGKLIV